MSNKWNEAEFLAVAMKCGFDISSEDIEALSKRKLITPWEGEVFGQEHLLLLAFYFDAVTVHRHPWSVRNSESSLQDVKQLNSEVSKCGPGKENDDTNIIVAKACRALLAKIDPFGPLGQFVEMLNKESVRELENSGRLSVELRLLLIKLEKTARPTSVTTVMSAIETSKSGLGTEPAKEESIEEENQFRDTEEATLVTPQAPITKPIEVPEEIVNNEPELEEIPVAEDEIPSLVVDGPDGIDGDKTIPVSGAFHSRVDESAEMVLTEIAEDSVPEEQQVSEVSTEGNLGLEESSIDMIRGVRGQENPFVPSDKTQALIARLKKTTDEEQDDIAAQIQTLNTKRQALISDQNWQGLADLYEEKIDLFASAAEHQEVLLTLATLHELKIKNPRRAVTFFQLAIENGSSAGLQKAYEGMQRVDGRPDLKAFCSTWLETRLNGEVNEFEMPFLQLANSNFLKECGKTHHAFLSYAAYLTRNPEKNVTEKSLQTLESYAEKIEDSELESFYTDILDFENESLDYSSTRSLIAKRAGLFYQKRNPMLAVKYLRINLDKNPNEEESYLAISHIYQEEENWPDLIHLASNRYKNLDGQDRIRAGVQLEQFIAEDINDENAVDRYYEWAKLDPNSWAVEGVIAAIEKSGRSAEGYGLLQNLIPTVDDVVKKEKIYLSLAKTALTQFESPEDALGHYESGLALTDKMGRGKSKLLAGLIDLQIEAGKWEPAMTALDQLTGEGNVLSDEEKLVWLTKGVQIAEQACNESKIALFKTRIAEI